MCVGNGVEGWFGVGQGCFGFFCVWVVWMGLSGSWGGMGVFFFFFKNPVLDGISCFFIRPFLC